MPLRNQIIADLTRIQSERFDPMRHAMQNRLKGWNVALENLDDWTKCVRRLNQAGLVSGDDFTITRAQMLKWVRDDIPLREQLLLTLVWGYGIGKGRGRKAVSTIMADSSLDATLERVEENLHGKKRKSAFNALKTVKGLGVSFLTKYLYFKTRTDSDGKYALIFDNRVSKNIVRLSMSAEEDWVNEIVTVQRRDDWNAYDKYCRQLKKIASEIELEPDRLELWLYFTFTDRPLRE